MGIEIKITGENASEIAESIAMLHAQLAGAPVVIGRIAADIEDNAGNAGDPQPEKPKGSASKPAKPAAGAASDASGSGEGGEKSKTSTTATSAAPPSDDKPVVYGDVQQATNMLAAAKGRAAVIELLGTFGVDHGSKLKEEQWAPYIEAAALAREG